MQEVVLMYIINGNGAYYNLDMASKFEVYSSSSSESEEPIDIMIRIYYPGNSDAENIKIAAFIQSERIKIMNIRLLGNVPSDFTQSFILIFKDVLCMYITDAMQKKTASLNLSFVEDAMYNALDQSFDKITGMELSQLIHRQLYKCIQIKEEDKPHFLKRMLNKLKKPKQTKKSV